MISLLASVIIPTRNRPKAVESCLDALAAQTLPPGSFEVIVVDDGSEPPLALDPSRWAAKFDLKLVRQQNTGPACARNRGVTEARGEFLAFTDDDCLPTPSWLEKLVAALCDHPNALVGGSTVNGLKNELFAETSQLILEMVYEHFNSDPQNAYFFASNNMACRKSDFLKLGKFDTTFPRAGAEDRDLCDRWRAARYKLIWRRNAMIEHRHTQSLKKFVDLHYRYGRGAFIYKEKRRARDTGTMQEDFLFHRTLPCRIRHRLGGVRYWRRVQICTALMLWQFVNAVGFFAEASGRRMSRRR